jgi:signal transduction histidine kinase
VTQTIMVGLYDYRIVGLSIFISMLGAFATLELADRRNGARGKARLAWLIGGAVASGIGTWAMHYTAMLALTLPVPVLYYWPTALLSYCPAFVTAAVALLLVGQPPIRFKAALAGSIFMGGGIAGLHYTGMAAMRFRGMHHYFPPLVILSVLVPMLLSFFPLQPPFLFRQGARRRRLRTVGTVLLLGSANPAMHFLGMAATRFMRSDVAPDFASTVEVSALGISGFAGVSAMVLGVALVTAVVDRLRQSRERLRALAARLQSIRESEQARIARDLHDELGQMLTALKIELRALEKTIGVCDPENRHGGLDRAVALSAMVDETLATVQRIAVELRPEALDRLGLVPALRQEVRRFEERTGIKAEAQLPDSVPQPRPEIATALFRICKEVLTNVYRHAGATKVVLSLGVVADWLVLQVKDDGRGFDPGSMAASQALGLLGMVERAMALGGDVRFESERGRGTIVTASIPLDDVASGGGP